MNSQGAFSEGPISAPTGRRTGAPLIGSVGQEYVQNTLSTNDPVTAIGDIQTRIALPDPRCRPFLGMLDQLGLSRADSHRYIVQQAIAVLLEKVPTLPPDRLLGLLEETFPYITIPDVRAVPLAVLDRLRPVPATFLKQLAADREIFWELPLGVQRQTWEMDKKLLQTHALPLVAGYTNETACWMQALNMEEAPPSSEALAEAGRAVIHYSSGSEDEDEDDIFEDILKNEISDVDEIDEQGGEEGGGVPGGGGGTDLAGKLPRLARRNLRNGSASLRRLVAMVGSSPVVYRGIVDLCTARFREGETSHVGMQDASLCALRSQLLMAMHDAGEMSITSSDACHKLAWTLDACLKDKMFTPRRLKELRHYFARFDEVRAKRDRAKQRKTSRSSRRRRGGSSENDFFGGGGGGGREDDAESAGAPGAAAADADPLQELGAAGMVLRDPAVYHLMLHQVVRCLERCVAEQAVPKDDVDLTLLTRLLGLAAGVRGMLREGQYDLPEVDEAVVGTLYPLIADMILDAELMEMEIEEDGDGGGGGGEIEPPPPEMVSLMVKGETGRGVVQTYALKRMAAGDLKSGARLLAAIERCLAYLSTLAIPEFAPFAFTLARRMASLLAEGKVTPSSPLWRVAVDGVLLRLVDAETEAHEEILRLLLAAAPAIESSRLGSYLCTTLSNSRRSRKAHRKRIEEEAGLPPIGSLGMDRTDSMGLALHGNGGDVYYSPGSDDVYGEYFSGGGGGGGRGADGVRGTYALFLGKQPGLTAEIAPELFEYLNASVSGEQQ